MNSFIYLSNKEDKYFKKNEIAMRRMSHQPKMDIQVFHLAFKNQIMYG